MANFVFNVALGRGVEWYDNIDTNRFANSAFNLRLIAATGVESDAVLRDLLTFAAVVAGSTNFATNTGYAPKILTDTDLTAWTPDIVNDRVDLDIPDQTWLNVANDGTGAISDLIIGYDNDTTTGDDTNIIPFTFHDFVVTPDGSNITAQISASGFFRAVPV